MISKVQDGGELFSAGRLSKPMSQLLRDHNEKPRLAWEKKHISEILQVDIAHVVMLAEQRLIDHTQAQALLRELRNLSKQYPENLAIKPGYGSMVLQIERMLASRFGEDTAGNVPIARSRLDQGATVRRMVDRVHNINVVQALLDVQDSLIDAAEREKDTPMISYTHLQQAQPANFGHYLLAFRDRLADSVEQLQEIYRRVNRSPLGAVGLSGTDLNINRTRTSQLLGFDQNLVNSRLGLDGYYQIELVTALAMVMTVLNDLCTELHIYSSTEFGTVELADEHYSTSSIFPQKMNPYALETIKGKAGESQGWVSAAFAMFRNEGTIDHATRSLGFLDQASETTISMTRLMSEVLDTLTVHRHRWEELLDQAWVTTNRMANVLLVKHGLSYRCAHSVIARLVKNSLKDGCPKDQVTVEMLEQAALDMRVDSLSIGQQELRDALDYQQFLQQCCSLGGVGPGEVERLIAVAKEQMREHRSMTREVATRLLTAQQNLEEAASQICLTQAI